MKKSPTWLVTGASRGIGLEMVKQLLALGYNVIGACRNPDGARDLWEIQSDYKSRFRYVKLDLNESRTIDELGQTLKDECIDVLVNNAGILKGAGENLMDLKFQDILKSFEVNTIAAMRVVRALMPSLQRSAAPQIINLTSKMGSIADNESGGYYGYRMSKAALNMFNMCLSKEFPEITTIVIHPGWVKTEMGGPQAPTEIYDSVKGIIKVASGLTIKDSGRFVDFQGKGLDW